MLIRSYFCLLFIAFAMLASAQKTTISLNDKSIVKDSAGTVYPFPVWQALLFKGTHKVVPEDHTDPKTAFYLVATTEEEREARLSRMPKPRESEYFTTHQLPALPQGNT